MSHVASHSTRTTLPRIAVVGCGAAATEFCFPALVQYPGFRHSVVAVDKNDSQAQAVATQFGLENHCTDIQRLPFAVDAAIVMTPHHLHAEQSIHFLRRSVPVFVEKPLGMSADEVTRMVDVAESNATTLMVNNCRRLFPAYRRVQELLQSGELGAIQKITISDGSPFDWNSVSGFYLRNPDQAKGVFLDRGAHTVDLVCWWLQGTPVVNHARYDAMGGGESLMKVGLVHEQTTIDLTFSRLFKLENCYTIDCQQGQIRGRLFQSSKFELIRGGRVESIQAGNPELYNEYPRRLLENFIDVVQGKAAPLFTAAEVAPSIALIEQAYRQVKPFEMPWYSDDPNIELLRECALKQN